MTTNSRLALLLLVTATGCASAQRQKLEADYRACVKEQNRIHPRFQKTDQEVNNQLNAYDDRFLEMTLSRCQTDIVENSPEAVERRARQQAQEKAAERRKQDEFYAGHCYPLELQTTLVCDERVEALKKLFQFNPDVCKRSVKLLHDACFGRGWDPVISEQDPTTKGMMIADYESRTVLGGCLLSSNNTLELEYASNETKAKCQTLAAAVRDAVLTITVKAVTGVAPRKAKGSKQ